MNQRSGGLTLLDAAKAAIEHFVKQRERDPLARTDRYFLITTEDGLQAVKSGWKESYATFIQEVKNLQAKDLTNLGQALKRAFDLLNQYRLQNGIDNYGQGRLPWFVEPASIIILTDGCALTSTSGVLDTLTVPLNPMSGSELTLEPFRWDQRVFSFLLQFSDTNNTNSVIQPMSEVTGGTTYLVHNLKSLLSAIESLVPRLQPGVVVNFEPLSTPSGIQVPAACLHKMLYVRPGAGGFWPIPEAFFPESNMTSLPPRAAQPTIKFAPIDADPYLIDNFPFDKYEIEPCALTAFMLSNKKGVCWQAIVVGSGPNKYGEPFGYIKASTTHNSCNLFVLPYNYPKLWPLLDELVNVFKMTPNPKWRQEFEKYLASIPNYYYPSLRTALKRFGATTNLIPDHMDAGLSYSIANTLKKLKQQSKLETDRLTAAMKQARESPTSAAAPSVPVFKEAMNPTVATNKNFHALLRGASVEKSTNIYNESASRMETENEKLDVVMSDWNSKESTILRNAFDIDRNSLLEHIDTLKYHILHQKVEDEAKHTVPIGQMGNYHEVLMKREVLRDIDEEKRSKPILFGNPFRTEKMMGQRFAVAIDEAEEDVGQNRGQKRRTPQPAHPHSPHSKQQKHPAKHSSSAHSHPKSPKPHGHSTATPPSSPSLSSLSPPASPSLSTPPTTPPASPAHQSPMHTAAPTQHAPHTPPHSPSQQSPLTTPPQSPYHPSTPPHSPAHQPAFTAHPHSPVHQSTPPKSPKIEAEAAMETKESAAPITEPKVMKLLAAEKAEIIKILRKPGKVYDEIFSKFKSLQVDMPTKRVFVRDVIQEAKRLKKAQLVAILESYLAEL